MGGIAGRGQLGDPWPGKWMGGRTFPAFLFTPFDDDQAAQLVVLPCQPSMDVQLQVLGLILAQTAVECIEQLKDQCLFLSHPCSSSAARRITAAKIDGGTS